MFPDVLLHLLDFPVMAALFVPADALVLMVQVDRFGTRQQILDVHFEAIIRRSDVHERAVNVVIVSVLSAKAFHCT